MWSSRASNSRKRAAGVLGAACPFIAVESTDTGLVEILIGSAWPIRKFELSQVLEASRFDYIYGRRRPTTVQKLLTSSSSEIFVAMAGIQRLHHVRLRDPRNETQDGLSRAPKRVPGPGGQSCVLAHVVGMLRKRRCWPTPTEAGRLSPTS